MLPIGDAQTGRQVAERLTWRDWRPTLAAAAIAAVGVAVLLVGFEGVSSFERATVVVSMADGIHWLASTSITACSTIAALTLTTLGLLDRLETRSVTPRFLVHLRLTVSGAFATLAVAVTALVVSMFPTATGGERTPERGEVDFLYWALLILTALIVGGLAIVLTSLASTIADVFRNLPHEWVEEILEEEAENEAA